jgi:hypothetical protein
MLGSVEGEFRAGGDIHTPSQIAPSRRGATSCCKAQLHLLLSKRWHAHRGCDTGLRPAVYGDYGNASRSLMAIHDLYEAGFTNLGHVEGGFAQWKYQKLPVDAP